VTESGWYILGPRVREFEAAFARYCGVAHCVGTGNGTDALELALRAAGVGAGDQVITAANAGGYGTTAILACGAVPQFADIDPATLLLDPAAVEAALAPQVRAILATHLYGRMVDMPRLLAVAERGNVPVVEDCAQAHGARLFERPAGSWGAAGCFSFYPTKNLGALGDGGAIVTADAALAERARRLRQYGWSRRYQAELAGGRNSRLDEMQAAILLAKLPHLDAWNERRRAIAAAYSEAFAALGVHAPAASGADYVAHLYVLRVPDREAFREALAAAGVGADVHYPLPDHHQPCWRAAPWAACNLPVTELCCRQVVTLPCFPELTDEEVNRVIATVARVVR
jgi:dTDP-4-amino-4,6-dideoxygalactose transaminase